MQDILTFTFISAIGGVSGLTAILWLAADWARKDERQKQQREYLNRVEARIDKLELRIEKVDLGQEVIEKHVIEELTMLKLAITAIIVHLEIKLPDAKMIGKST